MNQADLTRILGSEIKSQFPDDSPQALALLVVLDIIKNSGMHVLERSLRRVKAEQAVI